MKVTTGRPAQERSKGSYGTRWSRGAVFLAVVGIGAFSLSGIVVAQRHHRPAGPDAFLNFQVDSTSELVAALQADPALRRRYARHFGVSEARVIEFVKNALVPYDLPAARTFTTYGVTKSGRIYPVRTRLPQGTRVWATRSGEPVLKWLCANPLTKTLPGTRIAGPRRSRPVPGSRKLALAPLAPSVDEVLPPWEEGTTTLAAPPVAVAVISPSDETGVTVITGGAPGLSLPVPGGTAAGGRLGGFWIPLGLAVGLALPGGGSSPGGTGVDSGPPMSSFPPPGPVLALPDFTGSPELPPGTVLPPDSSPFPGSSTVPGASTPPESSVPPVPEPSAVVTMGSFLLLAGAGIARRRRQ